MAAYQFYVPQRKSLTTHEHGRDVQFNVRELWNRPSQLNNVLNLNQIHCGPEHGKQIPIQEIKLASLKNSTSPSVPSANCSDTSQPSQNEQNWSVKGMWNTEVNFQSHFSVLHTHCHCLRHWCLPPTSFSPSKLSLKKVILNCCRNKVLNFVHIFFILNTNFCYTYTPQAWN